MADVRALLCLSVMFMLYCNLLYALVVANKINNNNNNNNNNTSYKQERGCLMHFARLANTPLQDEESAQNDLVLLNSLPNKKSLTHPAINLS